MKPYYEHAGITIYHGDCREVLPSLQADVVLTDPPWPMKKDVVEGSTRAVALWKEVCPFLEAKRLLIWLPVHHDPRQFLNPLFEWSYLRTIFLRRCIPGYFGRVLMDAEVIHALGSWPLKRKGAMVIPGGMEMTYIASDRLNGHPAPRSLIAAKWLLSWWSAQQEVVLDPFMGSGTTLFAAKTLDAGP